MFGSATGSAGGFGATGGGFGAAPAAGGFGGFGAKPTTGATGGFGTAGGFGSTPSTGAAGGFGSAAGGFGTSTTPGTAGGFGAPAGTTGGFGAPATAGGFGAPSATAGASGGFGAPSATGGFGSATPAAAGGFGTGGFGSSTGATGGFGATTPAAGGFGAAPAASTGVMGSFGAPVTSSFGASMGGFGASAAKPATSFGSFGAAGTASMGAMGSSSLMGQNFGQVAQQQAAAPPGKIARSIEKLQQSYAPYQDQNGKVSVNAAAGRFNDECFFKTIMYDKRTGPAHAVDPSLTGSLLEEAEMNNPDPDRYYPVRIIGVDALKARFDHQQTETLKLKEHARNLKEVIEAVELSNTQLETRFSGLQMKQMHIYQKLMSLLRKVEVLRCRGLPMEATEIKYRARLNEILAAMKSPYLEIQELANNVAQQEFPQDVYSDAPSEADLESLYDALRRQREGLEYITDILTKDIRDVSIARAGMQERGTF